MLYTTECNTECEIHSEKLYNEIAIGFMGGRSAPLGATRPPQLQVRLFIVGSPILQVVYEVANTFKVDADAGDSSRLPRRAAGDRRQKP